MGGEPLALDGLRWCHKFGLLTGKSILSNRFDQNRLLWTQSAVLHRRRDQRWSCITVLLLFCCFVINAREKEEINATSTCFISHQGILYVLTHALGRWANYPYIAIMQFIAAGIWNVVQQDLISEGKLHSNGFVVLLSTLGKKGN